MERWEVRRVDGSGDVTTDHGQSNGNADSTVLELGSTPLCLASGISVPRQYRFRHVIPELPDSAGSARGHSVGATATVPTNVSSFPRF